MRSVLAVAALLVMGGCAEPTTDPQASPTAADPPKVEATPETGGIRGLVTDITITPIADAIVRVIGQVEATTTDAGGLFSFSGLSPGTYFVEASKDGFLAAQGSTEVTAGEVEPPLVRLLLERNTTRPEFTTLEQWSAHIQCGGYIATGFQVCGSANGYTFDFVDGRIPDMTLSEAMWEGNQPLGNYLHFGFYGDPDVIGAWTFADSAPPLMLKTPGEAFADAYGDGASSAQAFIFPGGGPNGLGPTVVVDQAYEIFVTMAYGFVPRDDYSFIADGACEPVERCM